MKRLIILIGIIIITFFCLCFEGYTQISTVIALERYTSWSSITSFIPSNFLLFTRTLN